MAIRNDYLLDMIQQFNLSIARAATEEHGAIKADALTDYNQVVSRVLDMPAEAVLELSPSSLVTMMQISAVDERLAVYMVYVLMRISDVLVGTDLPLAGVRRDQACAIADAYGFSPDAVPPEVQDMLDSQAGTTNA